MEENLGSDLPDFGNGSGMGKLEINSGIYMKVGSIPEKDEHSNYTRCYLELRLDNPTKQGQVKAVLF